MDKTKITVATIGRMPAEFDKRKITNWKSDIFSVVGEIESYSLAKDSDEHGWAYSDASLEELLPEIWRRFSCFYEVHEVFIKNLMR